MDGIHAVETVSSVATLGPVIREPTLFTQVPEIQTREQVIATRTVEGPALASQVVSRTVQPGAADVYAGVGSPGVAAAGRGAGTAAAGLAGGIGGESDAERQDLLLRIHSQDARILELRRRCKAERDQKMKTLDGLRKRMLALESVVLASRLVPVNEPPPPKADNSRDLFLERRTTQRFPGGGGTTSAGGSVPGSFGAPGNLPAHRGQVPGPGTSSAGGAQPQLKTTDFFGRPLGPKGPNTRPPGTMANEYKAVPDPTNGGQMFVRTPRGGIAAGA
mmetsp:Transcript_5524/g.13815  ORF Transcript_5524/g.13815 Transcript_5524/m.13815 type:complete len:276 (+) Transcript_5524:969-1796(+)|eukprot:g10786.t1